MLRDAYHAEAGADVPRALLVAACSAMWPEGGQAGREALAKGVNRGPKAIPLSEVLAPTEN